MRLCDRWKQILDTYAVLVFVAYVLVGGVALSRTVPKTVRRVDSSGGGTPRSQIKRIAAARWLDDLSALADTPPVTRGGGVLDAQRRLVGCAPLATVCGAYPYGCTTEASLMAMSQLQHEAIRLYEKTTAARVAAKRLLYTADASTAAQYLREERILRRTVIRAATCWAWSHVQRAGEISPEVNPATGDPVSDNWGGAPVTLLDALDTLWVMELPNAFGRALTSLKSLLMREETDAGRAVWKGNANLFETTIRQLGGLLSVYHLSRDATILDAARRLGDKLMGAFPKRQPITTDSTGTPQAHFCFLLFRDERERGWCLRAARNFTYVQLPSSDVTLDTGLRRNLAGYNTLSEVGSLQLEFHALSAATGDCQYHDATDAVIDLLESALNLRVLGLGPVILSPEWAVPIPPFRLSVGARGDSLYEYIIKEWLMTNYEDPLLTPIVNAFLRRLKGLLVDVPSTTRRFQRNTTSFTGLYGWRFGTVPKRKHRLFVSALEFMTSRQSGKTVVGRDYSMDHLVCFLPGTLTLAALHLPHSWNILPNQPSILDTALRLIESCVQMAFHTATGLPAETVTFDGQWNEAPRMSKYALLRPETIESLFVLARVWPAHTELTQWAWRLFAAMGAARAPFGFSSVADVDASLGAVPFGSGGWTPTPPRQHTWVFSETLKYLYLIFSTDVELGSVLHLGPMENGACDNTSMSITGVLQQSCLLQHWMMTTEAHFIPRTTAATTSNISSACGRLNQLHRMVAVP